MIFLTRLNWEMLFSSFIVMDFQMQKYIVLKQGFSTTVPLHFGPDDYLLRGSPVHCRILSSIPGLWPLDVPMERPTSSLEALL